MINRFLNIGLSPALAVALSLISTPALRADNYVVSNTNSSGVGSLSLALLQAQSDTNAAINIASGLGTIALSEALPAIQNNLVLNGNGNTINGSNAFRIFFVNAPGDTVRINDLALSEGKALGGGGGAGTGAGGGGAGLGGAIFLNAGALTVSGVSFSTNSAQGGSGGAGVQANQQTGGGGGGGGLSFAGGSAFGDTVDEGEDYVGPGAGGGALTGAGTSVNGDSPGGGPGGGAHGGRGGSLALEGGNAGNGGSPTLPDGGGGGGGLSLGNGNGGLGGNGSDFGGGGGAGSSDLGDSAAAGIGGFGGGGGGGAFTDGGAAYAGGNGGFGGGGGGGGAGQNGSGLGGNGGFGAGNGDGGSIGHGGGGLGAGGAIFARIGSTLAIQDSFFSGDTVTGGSSQSAGGSAIGQAVFLGTSVDYSVSSGTNTLGETIGGGNDTNGEGGFTKSGGGTLVLTSAESFVGSTTVSAGTLEITSNMLLSTAITIHSNAVLEYNFNKETFQPAAAFSGAGTLRMSGATVVFGPGIINVNFSPGALVDVESGTLIGSSSYGGQWTQNQAALHVASGAVFDAVEAGNTGAMQIDALTGAGTFEGGYSGNANGLSTVTIGIAGGSGTFSGILQSDANARLGIVKAGAGTETFAGESNTYSGGTTIKAGTLVINGTSGSGAVNVSGGILAGTGTIAGAVTIGTNGTLAPGVPVGAMTINNTLSLAGNTLVALNSGANSEVAGLASVSYGGTLTITNLGGALSAGNSFTLFSAGSRAGNFANIVGNPGSGLFYLFNPTNGVLSVEGNYPTTPTNLTFTATAGTMTVNWPANYTGWILQAQTNPPSMGISTNWLDVAGSAALDSMSFTVSSTNTVFFRLRLP